jgi:hypothetical protein
MLDALRNDLQKGGLPVDATCSTLRLIRPHEAPIVGAETRVSSSRFSTLPVVVQDKFNAGSCRTLAFHSLGRSNAIAVRTDLPVPVPIQNTLT